MKSSQRVKLIVALLVFLIGATGCGSNLVAAFSATDTPPPPTATATPIPTATLPPAATATPIPPTPTYTPASSPTPTWVSQGPGHVQVPILLYHHIAVSPIGSQYYVPPEKFDAELKLLRDWGYTSIPITLLVKAITDGAPLPPRPVVLTFDDGDADVYNNAFPIMQKYGFTGLMYIVANYMGTDGFMTADQIKQMVQAGWEVGSHSMSHPDFSKPGVDLYAEVIQSRKELESALDAPVLTFAYPNGTITDAAGNYVHKAGYLAAVGLGSTDAQGKGNLFYLQRRPINSSYDLKVFAGFLPWQGDAAFLPTDTPTALP
jgi:peptidoglycan/xylan/chitin deacetylase (PgdA/CDA1 family)